MNYVHLLEKRWHSQCVSKNESQDNHSDLYKATLLVVHCIFYLDMVYLAAFSSPCHKSQVLNVFDPHCPVCNVASRQVHQGMIF